MNITKSTSRTNPIHFELYNKYFFMTIEQTLLKKALLIAGYEQVTKDNFFNIVSIAEKASKEYPQYPTNRKKLINSANW